MGATLRLLIGAARHRREPSIMERAMQRLTAPCRRCTSTRASRDASGQSATHVVAAGVVLSQRVEECFRARGVVAQGVSVGAGHTIERRRGPDGQAIEELRDAHGALLAIALPEWDPVAEKYVRKVLTTAPTICLEH